MMYSVNRQVYTFEDAGGLASHMSAGGKVDLVMTEIHLPDGSGLELLDMVKRIHPEAIRIAVSGNPGDDQKAAKHHIDGFLAKPFTLNDLFAIVQRFVVGGEP
jgi:DNA-binding NtrC family response regulator